MSIIIVINMAVTEKILKENKKKRAFASPWLGILIFSMIILVGLPISVSTAYIFAFRERAYLQTSLCQIPITGKNKEEMTSLLYSLLGKGSPQKIILTYKDESFFLDPTLITYLPESTVEKSLKLGREKFPFLNLPKLIDVLTKGEDLAFDYKLNSEGFDSEVASVAAKLYVPPIDPQIKIAKTTEGKKVLVETGKDGQEVDLRTLKATLLKSLSCPQKEISLSIPVSLITPKVSSEMAQSTQQRASLFLNKEIKLLLDDQTWTIDDEEIISFLSFDSIFNRSKIENFVQEFAKTINTPPENAALHFEVGQNRVTVFKPSKEGITLKEAELTNTLLDKLSQLESSQESQEIFLPVIKVPPKITTANANSLGIAELLGRGTSLFRGSMTERIHNINLASLRLNGILIPPGETFSFNNSLGDVSQDTGFKQAYIIKEGRTILGDGGGVCQVSTTLFRAALNTGLPIIERHAHAYRVHYYEDDLGPGFDATVFDPTFDLKFKNDTPTHVLIQSSIDLKKKQLTFELYGAKDNRQIEISKARVWDRQPPPPDLYQDDPTLPTGTIKQIDWKAWGSKAAFDYKVTRGNEVIFEKTFTSVYKPWQAIYLRGTGR